MNIKLLDCTLRDGGYINDWNFSNTNIESIYKLNIYTSISKVNELELISGSSLFEMERRYE